MGGAATLLVLRADSKGRGILHERVQKREAECGRVFQPSATLAAAPNELGSG